MSILFISDHIHPHVLITRLTTLLLLLSHFSCVRLCDPIDGSPPGSSVPGILQARTLEWVAISFSNACMRAKVLQSCPTLCDPMDSSPQAPLSTGFSRQEYWSGLPFPSPRRTVKNFKSALIPVAFVYCRPTWPTAIQASTITYLSRRTERLHFHFSLSCIGEGNGNPLQCFCLENPWDRGAG